MYNSSILDLVIAKANAKLSISSELIEFPENLKEEAVKVLTESMETAASVFCKKLPIPADAEVGLGWIH